MTDPRAPARRWRWRWLRHALVGVAGLYLVACAAMFFLQDSFVFHPTSPPASPASASSPG